MDALSYLLQTVQLRTAVYATIRLQPPWGVRIPHTPAAAFHAVTAGCCWLRLDDTDPLIALGPGDVVVLPHGHAHTFFDEPDSPVRTIDPAAFDARPSDAPRRAPATPFAPDAATTDVVCGHLWFDDPTANPLVSMLPPLLHIRPAHAYQPVDWLLPLLQLVAWESDQSTLGGHALLTRLSDVIVIQTIRTHLAHLPPQEQGWLRALSEPQLGEALRLIHQHPEKSWTVAQLATELNLSRSTFAARFTRVVGEAPLQYLTRWRMHHAKLLLRTGNASIARVATQVGYLTEPAFSRAFKRQIGIPPSVYRHHAHERSTPAQPHTA